MGWHNLTIGRATVDRLLDRDDWYELYLPPARLAAASYADVWKLEDIAVELIAEYADGSGGASAARGSTRISR